MQGIHIGKEGLPFLLHGILKKNAGGGRNYRRHHYVYPHFLHMGGGGPRNERVPADRILRELESYGLKPGVFKPLVDTREVETKLLIEMDQLVWVGINILGTRAVVEIVERTEPPPVIDKSEPCNIVAKRMVYK